MYPTFYLPSSHNGYHNGYSPVKPREWAEGEIAYLRNYQCFSDEQWHQLEQCPALPAKATNHPVIILKKGRPNRVDQFYLVCTISAYSSGPENNYLPPWKQQCHQDKDKNNFRAFYGSEKVNNSHKHLKLRGTQIMPKNRSSWVHTPSTYIVPASVLGWFNKSPVQLRMTQESLSDLISHIQVSCKHWARSMGDWRICQPVGQPAPAVAPLEEAVTKALAAATVGPSAKTTTHVADVKETSAPKPVLQTPAAMTKQQAWPIISQGDFSGCPQETGQATKLKRALSKAARKATSQACKGPVRYDAWEKPKAMVCKLV